MKKRLFALFCSIIILFSMMPISTFAANCSWTSSGNPSAQTDYSFVLLGDIQKLTYSDVSANTHYISSIFDWILDKNQPRNIEYVFGLGDTIETLTTYKPNDTNPAEWELTAEQFERLSGIIPYSVVRGNHDNELGYHENICTESYKAQMDGFFYDPEKPITLGNSLSNSYRKITVCNQKYLMLSLDYNAGDDVIAWANRIITSNPDHRVIASVHAYLDGYNKNGVGVLSTSNDGFYTESIGASNVDDTKLVYTAFDGRYFWDNLFSKHENIFMVLCGHDAIPSPIVNTRTGKNGNIVIEILADTSHYDVAAPEPTNLITVLNFDEDSNKIELEFISPLRYQNSQSYHVYGQQRTITYSDLAMPDISVLPITNSTASVRLSKTNSGLRFKTNITKSDIESIFQAYPESNINVGTLIAPTDTLGNLELTHSFGKNGVDYIDVKATLDMPFAETEDTLIYAGSVTNLKTSNYTRDFTAVGYISYTNDDGEIIYLYSESFATRSISKVATAALKDTEVNYTAEQKNILFSFLDLDNKDPFENDIFDD